MSVVIVGGHDRMVCQYKKICKQFKCKAKVFTHMSADLNKQLGQRNACLPNGIRSVLISNKNQQTGFNRPVQK